MHIGFLCHEYPPGKYGGIGTFTQTLARALVQKGHQVTVIGVYRQSVGSENDHGVQVIRLPHNPIPRLGGWMNGQTLRKQLQSLHRATPLAVLDAPENGFALLGKRHFGKQIIRMHGGHHFFSITLGQQPQKRKAWFEQQSFRYADHFCAVSHFVADVTRRYLQMGNRPITILPNPVNTERFRPEPHITPQEGRIVFVGTLTEKKGVRQLVQAFPVIAEQSPQAHLQLIGRDTIDPNTDKSYLHTMSGLIPEELRSRTEFCNHVENVNLPHHLAQAEVAIFPSHMEAQGIVALEAMAMGKATIFSNTGPGAEIIEHGISGLLCDPHDPKSVAECAIQLLKDADLRTVLGQNARKRAVDCFSIDHLVERNLEFYRRCVG